LLINVPTARTVELPTWLPDQWKLRLSTSSGWRKAL
jgi:hypothetical protein